MKKNILKLIALIVAVVILVSTLFSVGIVSVATSTELSALNLKVSSTSSDARVMLTLPIDKGSNVEFSFDMKVESGVIPDFVIVDGTSRKNITPTKIDGYRYTFNYVANDSTYNTVQRWYFNFAKRTGDVVISNLELYKTDSNYENRLTDNLTKGIYGANGDFDGWDYSSKYSTEVKAGNILYIRNYSSSTINNADLNGTAVVTKPTDYFAPLKTDLSALNLKVSSTSSDARVMLTLPIDKGSNVEFSFDMKVENGAEPDFVIVDGSSRKNITPTKIEGYRYTFNYVANDSTYNTVQRWYFNFAKRTSDIVISNMELYKTDSNYESRLTDNLMKGVYGKNGDFDGWYYSSKFSSEVKAGNISYIRNYSNASIDNADLNGTAVVTKPLDYFEFVRTDISALNIKANASGKDVQAVIALPIVKDDFVEFSFDMKTEEGDTPKFLIRDNYGNKAIEPVKVEGYKYTFHINRTMTGDTGNIMRWFFDFKNLKSDVVISNMELYKTDSNYENRQGKNLLVGIYGKNGDFDGWSLSDSYVNSWDTLTAGKILYRGGTTPQAADYPPFESTAVVTKPIDYFEIAKTDMDALNIKANASGKDVQVVIALPIVKDDFVEFSFNMKTEVGETPKFLIRDNYGNKAIEPVKVEGYKYTFHINRTKVGDTGTIMRWFFDFANITSDVVISNMELYKTDSNYENKEATNLLAGIYGKNGDFDGWSLSDNYVSDYNDLIAGKILYRGGGEPQNVDYAPLSGTAVVTKPLNYFAPPKTKLTALNLNVSSTSSDARVMLTLPIDKGSNVEFSFDMNIESGLMPDFIIVDGASRKTITPTKVEGYRYTFNYVANDSTYNTVQRWYFNFGKRTSDVVISNMELYKTDSNYENRLTDNLMKGVYGENGDFDGWDYSSKYRADVNAGNIFYIRNYEGTTIDNEDIKNISTIDIPLDYFTVCESPKIAQVKFNKSDNKNSVYLFLNCKEDLYYELSFNLNYEESKGINLVKFQSYEGTLIDIAPINTEDYRYTFRFKANYKNIEVAKGLPFSIVFNCNISSDTTAYAYISDIVLKEYTDDTYSKRATFGNLASGENGYGKNGQLDEWNGKIVLEYDKKISTTSATKGDIWLKSDADNVSKEMYDCEIVDYNVSKFPPIKKMLHIVSTAKGYGRDIQLYFDCQKDKYYELSFKMKLEDGEIPKFAYKDSNNDSISISPVKVEGNKYTFNFKAKDYNISSVGQRFILDFDQVLSEVNISCIELYETDSKFKNVDKSKNLASGENGYGTDGCFTDWKSYIGKNGKGGTLLIDNYTGSSNKSYFYMEISQMKDGFIDKSTKDGEHMIKFTSYSDEATKAVFFFDCEKDSYYELSFYVRKETGDIPTFYLRKSYGSEYDITPYKIEGCKYIFRFRAQSDIQEFVMCFKKKLDAATIGFIVLNKSKDVSYSDIDTLNNLAAGKNGYGLNGDFDDWNENYTETTSGLGKIQLVTNGSDNLKVDFTKIPKDYFNVKIHSKPQMLHFKAEENFDYERFGLRFNLPNDPDATNYVFSYRLKLTNGSIGYIQTPDPSGVLSSLTAAYNYGDTYYFHLKNNARNNDSFAFNFYFPNTGVEGYITDLKLYAADGEYNIISDINLASIYGEFMDWSDRGSNKVGGITTLSDSVEIIGIEEWKDGFFKYPEFIPFLEEDENWWTKYDLTDKIDTGIIKGQLKDKSGNIMSDIKIRLSSVYGEFNSEILTDKNGKFEFSEVPIDEYSVSVVYSDGNAYTFDENILIRNKGDVVTLNLILNEKITIEYINSENSNQEDDSYQDNSYQDDYFEDDFVQDEFIQDDTTTEDFVPEDTVEEDTEDDNTDTTTKKVLKKKYYRRRLKDQGLPMIAWIGIAVGGIAIIAVAIIVVIRIKKKRKAIINV